MNDHAMKAAPCKTGAIILGGGERTPRLFTLLRGFWLGTLVVWKLVVLCLLGVLCEGRGAGAPFTSCKLLLDC
jgi:hypothetical protein